MSQPLAVHASSIVACLPEQFMRMRSGCPSSRTSSSRVAVSVGHAAGHPRSDSPSPAAARMSRTTATWRSVPEWLAVASARRSPSSVAGQSWDAVGIEDDRCTCVPRLDEPAALDDGEFNGGGDGQGLWHRPSLPPGGWHTERHDR